MFKSASDRSSKETSLREVRMKHILKFGVPFLDDALRGILKTDLILLGAPSGVGKTALCCNIALANIENGKRVHYIALEAEECEIEARLKFPLIAERFFSDPNRPRLEDKFNFTDWYLGKYTGYFAEYEKIINEYFEKAFRNLFTFYKGEKFGIEQFVHAVMNASIDTDLIIVDHVHYFDIEDENENKGIKKIAAMARTLALENEKPIILVAHLRKRDKGNMDLVADLEEFQGASDLYKIATRVITFSSGPYTESKEYITYFRVPKNRFDGGVTRFVGKLAYSPQEGKYRNEYQIGQSNIKRGEVFEEVNIGLRPSWYKPRVGSSLYPGIEGRAVNGKLSGGQKVFEKMYD